MMKKILFALLLCCTFLHYHEAHSQLLWAVSGNGIADTSYVYGTIHITDKRVFAFKPKVMKAFEHSQVMAGEILLNSPEMFQLLGSLFMKKDTTLQMLLDKAQYERIDAFLKEKLGTLAPMAKRIKPLFTSFLLQTETAASSQGEMSEPLDLYFQNLAHKQGKEVVGIETIREQIEAIDGIPLREQAITLYQEIAALQDSTHQDGAVDMEKMIQLYLDENLDSLESYIVKPMSPTIQKTMLYNRNPKMADRIDALIRKKRSFIGIGAAHLIGEIGVLELLRKKGYNVEAVR